MGSNPNWRWKQKKKKNCTFYNFEEITVLYTVKLRSVRIFFLFICFANSRTVIYRVYTSRTELNGRVIYSILFC